MTQQAQLKVALIGAGDWGYQHARVFSDRGDVKLVAIVGRSRERTQKRAELFHAVCYTDVNEMLDRERPDLVSICLPNEGHFGPTLQVIQAGFPVFAEKPLCFDVDEADTLIAEAGKRGLFFSINFNHRYARTVQLAKQAIDSGRLGEIVFASWRFGGEGRSHHEFANIIETQCHGFDLLEYLCGPIETVMAELTDKTGNGYSTCAISMAFANGAVGSLLGTYDSSYAYRNTQMLELNGTGGRVLIEDSVHRYSFQKVGDETAESWQAGYFNDADRSFHHTFDSHVEAMLAAFREGREPPVPADAGRRALLVAKACIESFQNGRRVECR